jgi:hypothetical protein
VVEKLPSFSSVGGESTPVKDECVPTIYGVCYGQCGLLVRRISGLAVDIARDPNSTKGSLL